MDDGGNLFAVDNQNFRIEKFDHTSRLVAWGKLGHGNGEFWNATCLALDSSGNVFVADTCNNRIQEFTSNGVFVTAWGTQGSSIGEFEYPLGVAVDSSGNVFVGDE